jgi:alkanesulfonate monooxygenase SsuD/methylene tetrahydromethanopterin reductase-like flavin-dependent oxidoreductase (luciferase family)
MKDRIGIMPFWKGYDRELYVRAAVLADELGYDSFWLPEAWGYDAFTLLTEVALKTKNIKVGTSIVNVYSRSAGTLAMTAASLDEISNGRLILGIGTSGKRVIEGFHGRAFEKPLTSWKDIVKVVKGLLAGKRLNELGAELHDYRPFTLEMKLPRRDVPIYIAALKQKSMETIGELADGWIPTFWPYQEIEKGKSWIAEGARRAGRDPSSITVAPFTTVIPTGKAGHKKSREIISFYVAGMGDYYKELLEGFGFRDECAKIVDLYANKDTREQAPDAVTDAMVEALSIAGDPAYCVAELKRRRDFGIDLPIITLPNGVDWSILEMFIRGLAPRS